jgi:hypothetical protein
MKKLIIYLLIRITTRHAKDAIAMYKTLYHSNPNTSVVVINNPLSKLTEHGKIKSKKQEVMDSIDYINSKKRKTKQDKDSLYSLEMVLKNM